MRENNPHYQVVIEPAARRSLDKIPYNVAQRILKKIKTLADNPHPPGSLKLAGYDSYRIRVGDYRVIYSIIDARLIVLVIDIGHRRDIYRNW